MGVKSIYKTIINGDMMYYSSCEYVTFNKWVQVENLDTGEKWFCQVSPDLTDAIYNNIINKVKTKSREICESGIIWVHTPLGGAIIGRRIDDEFGYYVNGTLKRCRVIKILS